VILRSEGIKKEDGNHNRFLVEIAMEVLSDGG
jgi:hypothetical protein